MSNWNMLRLSIMIIAWSKFLNSLWAIETQYCLNWSWRRNRFLNSLWAIETSDSVWLCRLWFQISELAMSNWNLFAPLFCPLPGGFLNSLWAIETKEGLRPRQEGVDFWTRYEQLKLLSWFSSSLRRSISELAMSNWNSMTLNKTSFSFFNFWTRYEQLKRIRYIYIGEYFLIISELAMSNWNTELKTIKAQLDEISELAMSNWNRYRRLHWGSCKAHFWTRYEQLKQQMGELFL